MKGLVLHPHTRMQLESYLKKPTQTVLLVGPAGSGKLTAARQLAERLLELPADGLDDYGYGLIVSPEEGKAIGIEAAREAERFLSLKVPGRKPIDRAIVIEDSHLLTVEAQNALLKTLEEPPVGTVILLTASHDKALLPTIRSRAQVITMRRPAADNLRGFFIEQGFDETRVKQAYSMSGGLPGLMSALLSDDDHPLQAAAEQARQLLSQPLFERLVAIESLSKQRELAMNTIDILQQMAHISLQKARGEAAGRWQKIMKASYEAADAAQSSAQLKLVLTDLVLQF